MKEEINKTMEILKNNQSKHSTYKTSKEYWKLQEKRLVTYKDKPRRIAADFLT
jgi:hypothetical protein